MYIPSGAEHTSPVHLTRMKGYPAIMAALVIGGLGFFAAQKTLRYLTCHRSYDLLSPTMRCVSRIGLSEWDYEPLRNTLIEKIEDMQRSGAVTHVSVYFRELANGPRFGIEEYESFYPASLLKLPVMIAMLHAADRDPALLDEMLTSPAALPEVTNVESADQTIQPNTPYSVRELLEKMIRYSDNDSKNLLYQKLNSLPPPMLYDTFLDLGITSMMDGSTEYISIQSYGYLFAVLYSAGYLTKESSQFALELLSQSSYDDGLVAGVPPGTRVAHKFGYRRLPDGERQLHDCGIVYHPSGSYVLCVMTSGSDLTKDAAAIADVSRAVFAHVSALQ